MPGPVYDVVFHEGHWRIRYQDLHIGAFETAEAATEAALRVVRSRIGTNGAQVLGRADGAITVGDAEEKN
jgi:hypothetical protein